MARAPRARGRPPAGPDGEQIKDYRHQFATRTRGDLFHLIRSLKSVTGASYRYILMHGVQLYLAQRVTKDDRIVIEKMTRAAQATCEDCADEAEAADATRKPRRKRR
jgi:hypothetical protein